MLEGSTASGHIAVVPDVYLTRNRCNFY